MVIDHVLVMSSTWMLILVSCPPLHATFPTQPTLSAPSETGVYTDSKIESGWSVTSCGASQGNETPTLRGNIFLLTFETNAANFWDPTFETCHEKSAHIHTFFICI